jgi:hypothetical protein
MPKPSATLLPLALVGAGLAWLAAANTKPGRRQAAALRHHARNARDTLYRSAGDVSHRAQEVGLGTVIEDYPLLAGFLGLALGAAIGASLPATQAEEGVFGDLGDSLIDRSRAAGTEAIERVQEAARAAVG